jgi:hypothetical protein
VDVGLYRTSAEPLILGSCCGYRHCAWPHCPNFSDIRSYTLRILNETLQSQFYWTRMLRNLQDLGSQLNSQTLNKILDERTRCTKRGCSVELWLHLFSEKGPLQYIFDRLSTAFIAAIVCSYFEHTHM